MKAKTDTQLSNASESKLKSNSVSLKQSLMGACTNFVYRIGALGGLRRVPHFLKKNQQFQQIVLLGERFSTEEHAKQRFLQLIWFTYRQKLKLTDEISSDVGWGCLPRVGQMLLAQALMRFFQIRGEKPNKSLYSKVILPFIDDCELQSQYCLSTILKYARYKFSINPGEWFNIGQIVEVLRKLQDENPLKGSQDLKLLFFSQSVIFTDQIYERGKVMLCQCYERKRICEVCHSSLEVVVEEEREIDKILSSYQLVASCMQIIEYDCEGEEQHKQKEGESKNGFERKDYPEDTIQKKASSCSSEGEIPKKMIYHQLKKDVVVIVSARIAEKGIDQIQHQTVLSLLNLPTSLGIIGGVPSKALYIVGHSQNQVVYLDPHFVQQQVNAKVFEQSLATFFCPQFRTINRQALDPSMAFCFYLRTLQDIQQLENKILEVKKVLSNSNKSCYLSVMDNDNFEISSKQYKLMHDSPQMMNSMEYGSMEFQEMTDSY